MLAGSSVLKSARDGHIAGLNFVLPFFYRNFSRLAIRTWLVRLPTCRIESRT
jgi:hypothetical protein